MREILFRGKAESGDWCYGDIRTTEDGIAYIFPFGNFISIKVILETVGMFTGLIDKNGKKIFEGDCIGCRENIVEYLNGTFTINGDRPLSWLKGIKDFIVVGNIHDNPELLEE